MKKWHVITGILAVLWLISLSACSSNSSEVDRLKDEVAELSRVKTELEDAKAELEDVKAELHELQDDYDDLQAKYTELQNTYTILQATKEMVFDNGIRVFDIHTGEEWGHYGHLIGKVQNVSSQPMKRVEILVACYDDDGSLREVISTTVTDLFIQEVAEWSVYVGIFKAEYAVYAFGNR